MKKLMFTLITATLLTGCAEIDENGFLSARQLDAELVEYFDYYTSATGDTHLNAHHVKFVEMSDDNYGICRNHYSARRDWNEVLINPKLWKTLSDLQKTALMLHEFGHCEGGHGHNASYYHIMYPYLQSEYFLRNNWTAVMEKSYGSPTVSLFAPANDLEVIYHDHEHDE